MTEEEFNQFLRAQVKRYGSQKELAKALGISPQYLNDVLAGRREPGDGLLKPMGFRKRISYIRLPK